MAKRKPKKKNGDIESAEEKAKVLEMQLESLRHRLVLQTNKSSGAAAVVKDLRQRYGTLAQDFEEEKQLTFKISAEMTRHYKAMRKKMQEKITELQEEISAAGEALEHEKKRYEKELEKKDTIIQQKDQVIEDYKRKMKDVTAEFGLMLKETLEGMNEKIEITSRGIEKNRSTYIDTDIQTGSAMHSKTFKLTSI
ncbi:hypothetical protein AAMO2058_000315200 [Amorphochlora amoebiformis]